MARTTSASANARVEDIPEMSELMAPFIRGSTDLDGRGLTPYKVTLLALLEQYLTCELPDDFSAPEKRRIMLAFLSLLRTTYLPCVDLHRIICLELQSDVMRKIFQITVNRAVEMNPDLFMTMLYGCVATIMYGEAKSVVRSTSLAGQFTRKMFISYKKASFSEISRLLTDYGRYFEAAWPQIRHLGITVQNQDIPKLEGIGVTIKRCLDSSYDDQSADHSMELNQDLLNVPATNACIDVEKQEPSVVPSQKEALAFILKQIYLLEHEPATAMSYASMVQWIKKMRQQIPSLYDLHFLEYLNELRIKDFAAAEEILHRYLDTAGLTLMTKGILDMTTTNRITGPANTIIPTSAFRSLRYGPLLLADMHRRFGNEGKALAYLEESIKNAEEANDKSCLDHAVALFSVMKCAKQRKDYQRLLDQALKDTEDRNATALHLRCHLSQLLRNIEDSENVDSITVIKQLIYSEINEKLPGKDHDSQKAVERSIKNSLRVALSSAYLQRGYWDAACLEVQKLISLTRPKTADVNSIAVVNMAYGLVGKGQYYKAKQIVQDSKRLFPMYTAELDRLNLAEAVIGFEAAFLSGDDGECKRHLATIQAISSVEATLRKAIYDTARGINPEGVLTSMNDLLGTAHGTKPYIRCRLLLILGRLYLHQMQKAGTAHGYFVQCQQLSRQHRFNQISKMADRDLIETKAALGISASCASEMVSNLPDDQWCLNGIHAACDQLSKARTILKSQAHEAKDATRAVGILEDARGRFQEMNAQIYERQVHALLAIAYNQLGNNEERNRASKSYRKLHERLRSAGFTVLIF